MLVVFLAPKASVVVHVLLFKASIAIHALLSEMSIAIHVNAAATNVLATGSPSILDSGGEVQTKSWYFLSVVFSWRIVRREVIQEEALEKQTRVQLERDLRFSRARAYSLGCPVRLVAALGTRAAVVARATGPGAIERGRRRPQRSHPRRVVGVVGEGVETTARRG